MSVRFRVLVLLLVAVVLTPSAARAQQPDPYTISVLTMSPGDPVFFKFGHNAILVRDHQRGTERVYNWGTFSFHEPGLVTKFLQGRLTYWLSVSSLRGTLRQYESENRWVAEQELQLTAEQKQRLVQMVQHNALPENATYRYDYYLDNCSTRVRDVVDVVTGGRLRQASKGPGKMTFRGQTSRLTADAWWAYVFLNLAMGSYIDQPITEWEEMFVPGKLHEMLARTTTVDEAGREVPLVKQERMLVQVDRVPPLDAPPNRVLPLLAVGMAVGALLGWAAFAALRRARDGRMSVGRRLLVALPLGALGGFTGFLGALFVFFWTLTDHRVAYHNENLLQTSPLGLLLMVVAVGILFDWRWARRWLRYVAYAVAGLSVAGLVLQVLPWFNQVNGEIIALHLPIWCGLAAGVALAQRHVSNSQSRAAKNTSEQAA